MLIPFEGTVHLNHSSKMKMIKKSQSHKTIEIKIFLHFCFLMEVFGPGSKSVQINYGSRFRRPKNIGIRNTGWQDTFYFQPLWTPTAGFRQLLPKLVGMWQGGLMWSSISMDTYCFILSILAIPDNKSASLHYHER